MPAVCFKLSFAGAARSDRRRAAGGCLAHKVSPHARQARQQVFVLRKLNLKLTLARLCALGENIEDKPRAVEHLDPKLLAEYPHLRRRQLVVENGKVAVVHFYKFLQLCDLTVADEAARIGSRAVLNHHADGLTACRFDKRGKLLHRDLA